MIYRCVAVLVGVQNPPPLATLVDFDTWKTLPTTVPETCDGAMRQANRCSEGQFRRYWAVAEQAYLCCSIGMAKSCIANMVLMTKLTSRLHGKTAEAKKIMCYLA